MDVTAGTHSRLRAAATGPFLTPSLLTHDTCRRQTGTPHRGRPEAHAWPAAVDTGVFAFWSPLPLT